MSPAYFETQQGRRIAYHRHDGSGPGLVFLGGFRSDMTGSKAAYLEDRARQSGRAFLRLDYSGHGASSGDFLDGTIGDWAMDAQQTILAQTQGPQVVIGSSMGGWISLILARRMPEKFAGLVGIAAAPDFTEDSMWDSMDATTRKRLEDDGQIALPSEYSDEPYVITKGLIEDGRAHLVLRDTLRLPFAVRLLHGTADEDVEMSVPLRLLDHAECPDMRLTLVKGAGHRLSEPAQMALIWQAVTEVLETV